MAAVRGLALAHHDLPYTACGYHRYRNIPVAINPWLLSHKTERERFFPMDSVQLRRELLGETWDRMCAAGGWGGGGGCDGDRATTRGGG